jgi:hypothetical protein
MDMIVDVVLQLLSFLFWRLSQTVPTPQRPPDKGKHNECVSGIDEME